MYFGQFFFFAYMLNDKRDNLFSIGWYKDNTTQIHTCYIRTPNTQIEIRTHKCVSISSTLGRCFPVIIFKKAGRQFRWVPGHSDHTGSLAHVSQYWTSGRLRHRPGPGTAGPRQVSNGQDVAWLRWRALSARKWRHHAYSRRRGEICTKMCYRGRHRLRYPI